MAYMVQRAWHYHGATAAHVHGSCLVLQLVELKNGETYNGHMVQCDSWMNVHLREVICTSKVLGRAHATHSSSTCRDCST